MITQYFHAFYYRLRENGKKREKTPKRKKATTRMNHQRTNQGHQRTKGQDHLQPPVHRKEFFHFSL